MSKDTIVEFGTPATSNEDPLTELLQRGARQLIAAAVEAELSEFLKGYQEDSDAQGRRQVVRNGYLPAREVQTGLGPVEVRVPKVRDRSGSGVKFHSATCFFYVYRTFCYPIKSVLSSP